MKRIGIIGGSAFYKIENAKISARKSVTTPFGKPSGKLVVAKMCGQNVVFIPRHGEAHTILPSEVNSRANIYALKKLGCDAVISVSAVGSLKEELKPLDIVLCNQFIDRTNQARKMTFFGDGMVAHIPFGEPVCTSLRNLIYDTNKNSGITLRNGGTYINMEGPAFSTKAESNLYRSWGVDVIGMTNLSEAKLAREAGMCYATIAMVTDYDCWYEHPDFATVTVDIIIENLNKNVMHAKKMLTNTLENIGKMGPCDCCNALRTSIVTRKENIPAKTLKKLKPIIEGFI
ncbi:MAG: S-methyl-5'-thioadenosine phosphorylase [Candidatus Omnitrophica bacterium]|nr:S-methyl-5'-thioadenosine phosphorylase [Candidatus Omnitrophota bacterium]